MAVNILLPQDQAHWSSIEAQLIPLSQPQSLQSACQNLAMLYYAFKQKPGPEDIKKTPFAGLHRFMEDNATESEREQFLNEALPTIAKLAIESASLKPKAELDVIKQQEEKTLILSRHFIACLVATGFLNLFDELEDHDLSMPSINFTDFFNYLGGRSQSAKLRMILNYFVRLTKDIPKGNITFRRIVLPPNKQISIDALCNSEHELCPFLVKNDGKIEDAGMKVLQMDFANEYLGGGVLWTGNVQEEIRFSICPELLSSMLFMESMAPNEAIIMEGFEQFSEYAGYGGSLKFAGDYQDPAAAPENRGPCGEILTSICAIDAIPYMGQGGLQQYFCDHLTRDINKAYVGFLQPHLEKQKAVPEKSDCSEWVFDLDPCAKRVIATGNWGCGVFGGNPQLKSLLQWVVASHAECPAVAYYTFSDKNISGLDEVVSFVEKKKWTIGELMTALALYCKMVSETERMLKKSLFEVLTCGEEETVEGVDDEK